MSGLRRDLQLKIERAQSLDELKVALLEILNLLAVDHDRLFDADKHIRESIGLPHRR